MTSEVVVPLVSDAPSRKVKAPVSFQVGLPVNARVSEFRDNHGGPLLSWYERVDAVDWKVEDENSKVNCWLTYATGGTCELMGKVSSGTASAGLIHTVIAAQTATACENAGIHAQCDI